MRKSSTILAGLGFALVIFGTSIAEPMNETIFAIQMGLILGGCFIMLLAALRN